MKINSILLMCLAIGLTLFSCKSTTATSSSNKTGADALLGKWKMVSMNENIHNGDQIFQCQIMQGEKATAGALNVSVYTKYEYQFKKGGEGSVSFADTDGNKMGGIPISWEYQPTEKTVSITTDFMVTDERVYEIVSMEDGKLKLKIDHTYPMDDELERGGQRLTGNYVLQN